MTIGLQVMGISKLVSISCLVDRMGKNVEGDVLQCPQIYFIYCHGGKKMKIGVKRITQTVN